MPGRFLPTRFGNAQACSLGLESQPLPRVPGLWTSCPLGAEHVLYLRPSSLRSQTPVPKPRLCAGLRDLAWRGGDSGAPGIAQAGTSPSHPPRPARGAGSTRAPLPEVSGVRWCEQSEATLEKLLFMTMSSLTQQ